MKKILTNNIIEDTRRQPFNKISYEHIQEAFQEVFNEILKGITDNVGGTHALYGCIDSDISATGWAISEGAIFYNGEVFQIPLFVGSHATNVPVLNIVSTFRAGDPVTFSDNNTFNVHQVRTMAWTMGASGSGLLNFSSLTRFKKTIGESLLYGVKTDNALLKTKVIAIGDWNMQSTVDLSIASGVSNLQQTLRSIDVMIRKDNDSELNPFLSSIMQLGGGGISNNQGSVNIDSGNFINLRRTAASIYDSTNYDSTSFNRGWITIVYEV